MRGILVFTLMIALLGIFCLPSVVWAGDVAIKAPESVSGSFTATLEADAGSQALGAFEINVYFNPNVIAVSGVQGGKTGEFSRAPIVNINNKEGVVFLTSFQAESLVAPKGLVDIASIKFKVIGLSGDNSPLSLEVKTLVDTNGGDIAGKTASGNVTVK